MWTSGGGGGVRNNSIESGPKAAGRHLECAPASGGPERTQLDKLEDVLLIFAGPLLWSTLLFHIA